VLEGEELIKEEKQSLQRPLDIERMRTPVRNRMLQLVDNVLFTPHKGFNCREGLRDLKFEI